jgi:hypothetical protein
MTNIELRPPKRQIQKERDQLMPILCVIVAVSVIGFMYIRDKASKTIEETAANEPPQQQRTETPKPTPPVRQTAPRNQITTESGRTYYVEPTVPRSYERHEPTPAERYARASRIMESTSSAQPSRQYSYRNNTLRIAENACQALLRKGTIAYRECRAAQWHRLRDGCIQRRSAMNITTGRALDELRNEVEEWCTAEAKYQIID